GLSRRDQIHVAPASRDADRANRFLNQFIRIIREHFILQIKRPTFVFDRDGRNIQLHMRLASNSFSSLGNIILFSRWICWNMSSSNSTSFWNATVYVRHASGGNSYSDVTSLISLSSSPT